MEYSINFKPSKASFLQKKILFSFPLKINRQLVKMFPPSWMSYGLNEGDRFNCPNLCIFA